VGLFVSSGRLSRCQHRFPALSPARCSAAKRVFQKALRSPNHPRPRVIKVDKNPSCLPVVEALKAEGTLRRRCRRRPHDPKVTKRWRRFVRGRPDGWASVKLSANSSSSPGCSRFQSDATPASMPLLCRHGSRLSKPAGGSDIRPPPSTTPTNRPAVLDLRSAVTGHGARSYRVHHRSRVRNRSGAH
jgi:hypothetical protein